MKKFKKIYVEITNICNLNCSFCSKDNKAKKFLSVSEFETILNKINDYTDYLYLHVKGEPLMHPDLDDILKLCNKYNKKVNITTNGTLLSKRDILIKNKVRQVNISLHNMAYENLLDVLNYSYELAKNNIYVVYRFWVYNDLEKSTINEILKYYDRLDLINDNSNNIKINDYVYINKDEMFIWPSLNNNINNIKGTCLGLKTHIGILSDGTIIPCCLDSNGIINLGNIFNEDLIDVLNNIRTKKIIEGFNNNKLCEELCRKCGFKR